MTIDELRAVLPPPATPAAPATARDWTAIEGQVGSLLPPDYKQFVEAYGPGRIADFLMVFTPFAANANADLTQQVGRQVGALRQLRDAGQTSEYPLFPEPGGLMPWGVTDNGDILLWLRSGEPAAWPVVISVSGDIEFERFDLTMSSFLAQVLGGAVRTETFPEDFPGEARSFEPLPR